MFAEDDEFIDFVNTILSDPKIKVEHPQKDIPFIWSACEKVYDEAPDFFRKRFTDKSPRK